MKSKWTPQALKRAVAGILAVIVGVFALSGCVKYDGKVVVNENDTVTGSYYVGFNIDALVQMAESMQAMGGEATASQPPQDFKQEFKTQLEQGIAQSPPTPGITPEYMEKDGFMGVNIKLDNVDLATYNEFAQNGLNDPTGATALTSPEEQTDSGSLPQIVRKGDEYVVTWQTSELSGQPQPTETAMPTETMPGFEEMMKQFMPQIDMQITFPGAVTEANGGIVMGNTVKWDLAGLPKDGKATAKASAIPNGQGTPPAETAEPAATPQTDPGTQTTPGTVDEQSSSSSPIGLILIGGIIILGLAAAAVVAVVLVNKNKNKNLPTPDQNPYSPSGQNNGAGIPPIYPPNYPPANENPGPDQTQPPGPQQQ